MQCTLALLCTGSHGWCLLVGVQRKNYDVVISWERRRGSFFLTTTASSLLFTMAISSWNRLIFKPWSNHQHQYFLMKWGCRGHWGHWGCWGCWGHWGHRYSKAWKIATEHSRVIQVVRLSFILMFWKLFFFSGIMKYNFSIFAPILLEAVEASLSYFFENWF